ncbi:general substrate transporter [Sodiomyces alkalinus F11]|uniref:General substrate transporter n=1 Tax=Sodiomyces alkalinus (strain CBS 110278 / VKM F-3762 / F11) TaxID=1314773 RepID=A0A3N2Q743_SODAK|nr:general substrate transporter [Sodiomyces alkalinus F11]ROT42584.1 general substrate transporter [Sodiomyces alkalinus F11]
MWQASNVYGICAFAALGGALFGFDISSMSGVLGTEAYRRYFDHPLGYRQGGITASMPIGSFFGALASSFIADRFSRKRAIQLSCIIWVIGATFQAAAQNVAMLCVGRWIAGFCVGICSAIVPVYQAEIAPKEIRGRVVSLQQWAITWGILIQFFIQYAAAEGIGGGPTDPNQPTAAFRIPWGVQMVPGVILGLGLFFCPYSPRWLASKDRWEEAMQVLVHVHGKGNSNDPRVLAQYQEIEETLKLEREQAQTSFKTLTERRILKRVIIGCGLQLWSQLSGMNIMMYYIVYIMQGAGLGSPLLTASVQYIINVVMTLPAIIFLDKWGRRKPILAGFFGMMIWLFVSGGLQQAYGEPNTDETRTPENQDVTWIVRGQQSVSIGVVAASYLFVATFATTIGPTSWAYPAEIYPSRVRAKAVSLSTSTNWLANTALAFAVPPLLEAINYNMYYIFAAFNGLAFIHMFLMAPETKGFTLEEMDDVFDSGVPAWRTHVKRSRLDDLEREIEQGKTRIEGPVGDQPGGVVGANKAPEAKAVTVENA